MKIPAGIILILALQRCCAISATKAAEAQRGISRGTIDFRRDIQPIFADRCYSCHGPEKQKSGLRLDRKADALAGGDAGKAIIPRKSADSLLIRNVLGQNPDTVMPPKGERLSKEQIAKLRAWIDQGAPWPEELASKNSGGKADHWAFKAPVRPPIPQVRNKRWVRNPIDAFVLARLEKERIVSSPEADKVTLIRRLSFDLIGLPPTYEEVERFVADRRPEAYQELVERLLRSPHFGERWGRHWLDLARYADSDGYEKDGVRPYAYLYRDWVIDAINRDLPFDEFTIEQLAGDLLPNAGVKQKTATGFHRQTLTNKEGGVDQEEFRCKATVDRATTTGSIWLGLTVGCAECHSHKYDPITQREFYQFYAFFNNANENEVIVANEDAVAKYEDEKRSWDAENERLKHDLFANTPDSVSEILKVSPSSRSTNQQAELAKYWELRPEGKNLDAELAAHTKKQPKIPGPQAAVLAENQPLRSTHVHVRGDFLRKGEEVQPGTLAVLHPFTPRSSRPDRLDLAHWLFDPANPLTARVTVNRIWMHLFSRGLVNSVNDFGTRGDPPSHPELLDWLATELPRIGWSRKELIRLIVNSATYRQSSTIRPELLDRDANNVLLARQNRFRLEAEAVRDSFLSCSELLVPKIGGPSIRPPLPADITSIAYANMVKWKESEGEDRYRRGLYIFLQRTVPYPMLITFDAPDSNVSCTRRERSNTPLQALTLLNDNVFFECAQALGKQLAKEQGTQVQQIRRAFQTCIGRAPTSAETDRLLRFSHDAHLMFEARPENPKKVLGRNSDLPIDTADAATLVVLCRTIMNLDEFLTRE